MAGKNHIGKSIYLFWDDSGGTARNLTADMLPDTLSGPGLVMDEVDMTGQSQPVKNYLAGQGRSTITAKFHMNDTSTTGSFTVIKNTVGSVGTLTVQYGQNGAAPTTGDPEWEGEYVLVAAPVTIEGGRAVLNPVWEVGSATAPAWGTV